MFTTRTAVEQSIPRFESHKLIAKSNVESITNQPIAFTQPKEMKTVVSGLYTMVGMEVDA